VLLVIKCLGYGGAERLLVDMVAAGDRRRFEYEVAYVLRDLDALVPSVVKVGTPVHALGAAHNADLRWMASWSWLRCPAPPDPAWCTPSTACGTGSRS
jgi:hypothetical protein